MCALRVVLLEARVLASALDATAGWLVDGRGCEQNTLARATTSMSLLEI